MPFQNRMMHTRRATGRRVKRSGHLDTNWLEDFTCFARTLNFTRAAEERNITQSAFSRRMQNLEHWLGVDLVDRSTYPARLSRSGEEFLPVARDITQQLHRSRDRLRSRQQGTLDTVCFAAPHAVSIHHLTPLIRRLERDMPNLRTRVMSDDLHTCCEYFEDGLCEFLMNYRHSHIPLSLDEQRYTRHDLLTDTLLPVCVSKSRTSSARTAPCWSLPGGTRSTIPLLAYAPGSFLGSVVDHVLGNRQHALVVRHVDAFAEALRSLALEGAGIAWLPEVSVREDLASGRLVVAGGPRWQTQLTLSLFVDPNRSHTVGSPGRQVLDTLSHIPFGSLTG